MICTKPPRRLLLLMATAAAFALPILARSAEPDTVTIEANKERELKRQISKFVAGAVFTYMNDSLERWNTPVCPLVAGLPKERGEFVLGRVSAIARDAHAPLGSEHCKPNLYIVVSDNPDDLLKKWSKRDISLFNTCNGMGYVREFMHSRQPIRAYYNARFSSEGADNNADFLELQGLRFDFSANPCMASGGMDTRLRYGAVQKLTSVIVVVDSRQTTNINMGQLADYIGMVGLAQIRVEANTGTAPTILGIFRQPHPQLAGLSPWDKAFLHSLYTTDQASTLEVTMIKRHMFEQIVGR
jgi:hypothetical protein